jgi:predicted AAA+ superfamily ATPase
MIKTILIEQNPHWDNKLGNYTKRTAFEKLIRYLPLKQIITITGIRRCGKSTLAKSAINYLINHGTNPKNILFINLEQPMFLEFRHDPSYLGILYEEYLKLVNPQGKVYVVFDEIQFFDNWQVYIKSKYESSDMKFIITGSNSSMLSNDLNTLLTGRSLNIHLDTFSFKEFLEYRGIDVSDELHKIANKIAISRAKDEYIKWGGFYEVFEIDDELAKKELLISYAKNIIYRDIVPRYGIRNSEVVERLFFYLASNTTSLLNYTTLSQIFAISDKTIKEYIHYFEEVFLFQRLDRFHTKPKERIKSTKKIYIKDNGFLQIAPKDSANMGIALENLVFNVLFQKESTLTYLRDTYEIDFYAQETLYQVSYDISDDKTKKRELNAFEHFRKEHQQCKLITYDINDQIGNIEIVSFEQWTLNA